MPLIRRLIATTLLAVTAVTPLTTAASENPDSKVGLVSVDNGRGLVPMVDREPVIIDRKKIIANPKRLLDAGKLRRVGQGFVLDLGWSVPPQAAKRIEIHVVDIEPIAAAETTFEAALARLTKRGTTGGCPEADGSPPKTPSRLACKSQGHSARCEVDLNQAFVFKYAITVETSKGKVCVDPTGVIH